MLNLSDRFIRFVAAALLMVGVMASAAQAQPLTQEFGNELGISWPWELTYVDVDADAIDADKPIAVTIAGIPNKEKDEVESLVRPGQLEWVTNDKGKKLARVWFIATVEGKPTPKRFKVTVSQETQSPKDAVVLSMQDKKDHWLINNGIYEFRVKNYGGELDKPTELNDLPHWIQGHRQLGSDHWDGRAWFQGSSKVKAVDIKILNQGPVFVDMRIQYIFENPGREGTTEALPMALGKQTHLWKPNQPPRETIPKEEQHFTVLVRFVAGDPWIEVNERYRLPDDKSVPDFGIQMQWLHWGNPAKVGKINSMVGADDHIDLDTVSWVRWFEYDKFGGNTTQRYVPAEPRPEQKGRPFVMLRPRWNQGGGGGQDFFLMKGLKQPYTDKETKERVVPADYDPDSPAVGLVAAFASKWVGPYVATITCYAYDGDRGTARLRLSDDGRSDLHYGQRSFGLCIGPRKMFGNINNIVRRHTDWTLVAQMHKYILSWERDPQAGGPHILMTKESLKKLRDIYKTGSNPTIAGMIRETAQERDQLRAEVEKIQQIRNRPKEIDQELKKLDDEIKQTRSSLESAVENGEKEAMKHRQSKLAQLDKQREELVKEIPIAQQAEKNLTKEQKNLHKELDRIDFQVLKLIEGEDVGGQKLPQPDLWIARRYQDDFLNPTQRTVRAMPGMLMMADLFSNGKPIGGPWQAAIGYIFTDLDHWPGWHQGWSPGNPNFHTDKYMPAAMVGAAMPDHPHAREWLQFGYSNFQDDVKKVFYEPDGVGYECPGYSGYSMNLQMETAHLYHNAGFDNPVIENPLFVKSAHWHRKLFTPVDARLGFRHEAPIGDTHRWTSGLGQGFGTIAKFLKDADPEEASRMMGAMSLIPVKKSSGGLMGFIKYVDPSIPAMDPEKLDWSSEAFFGFGTIMRTDFGTPDETFLTFKAGRARGHAHNEELSYHYYEDATPISLDYNCSYHPRGDHAALHNSMTFGKRGMLKHNQSGEVYEALEELGSTGYVGAFVSEDVADLVVAERSGNGLAMRPWDPHQNEFGRQYPWRKVEPIIHRRFLMLVKHDPKSKFANYLVVRDETQSNEPQQINVHLLAREADIQGDTVQLTGQLNKDMIVKVVSSEGLRIEERAWYYYDEWQSFPEPVLIRPGESQADWAARLKKDNVKTKDVEQVFISREKREAGEFNWYFNRIKETKGKALMIPPGWDGTWMTGEYQIWLRMHTKPGSSALWVLYPYDRGSEKPVIEKIADGKGVRITLDGKSEEIMLAGSGQDVMLKRDGKTHTLLKSDELPELGQIKDVPLDK